MNFKLLLLILAAALANCTNSKKNDSLSGKLKHQKFVIDSLATSTNLILFVKPADKKHLIQLKNGEHYPGKIEAAYNVLKNPEDKVVYVAEIPFSPKDDWFIVYKNYFDEKGKLFAFQRLNNFFHSECTKGAALESLTKFYNDDFSVADSSYTLTDSNKKTLDKESCKFPYSFPYTVAKTLEEYRKIHQTEAF